MPHAERTRVVAGDAYALATAVLGADVVCDLWPASLGGGRAGRRGVARRARVVRVRCLTDASPPARDPGSSSCARRS